MTIFFYSNLFFHPIRYRDLKKMNFYFMETVNIPVYEILRCI